MVAQHSYITLPNVRSSLKGHGAKHERRRVGLRPTRRRPITLARELPSFVDPRRARDRSHAGGGPEQSRLTGARRVMVFFALAAAGKGIRSGGQRAASPTNLQWSPALFGCVASVPAFRQDADRRAHARVELICLGFKHEDVLSRIRIRVLTAV